MVSAGRRDQAVADRRVALQEVAALVVEFPPEKSPMASWCLRPQ
jgi:hypothetical protein